MREEMAGRLAEAACSREIVLDLETTGLSPEDALITEIAAVRLADGETFSVLVDPGVPIPPRITALTGITDAMVKRDGVEIGQALAAFDAFCGEDLVIIGHNVKFDYSFLKTGIERAKKTGMVFPNWDSAPQRGIDTLQIARKLHPKLPHKDLESVAAVYGIENENAHRALSDTMATAQLYIKLKEDWETANGGGACWRDFLVELQYRPKKQSPATDKQKRYLASLLERHGLSCGMLGVSKDVEELTKSEASRLIDHILSGYGQFLRR